MVAHNLLKFAQTVYELTCKNSDIKSYREDKAKIKMREDVRLSTE